MPLRVRSDRLVHRAIGALIGLGFLLLGLWSAFGADALPHAGARNRALWLGITMIIVGSIAVASSLTVERLDKIWCRHPRRWGRPW